MRTALLEPLSYCDVDRLVTIRTDRPHIAHAPALTGEEFFALRDRRDVFEEVATVNDSHASITEVEDMSADTRFAGFVLGVFAAIAVVLTAISV